MQYKTSPHYTLLHAMVLIDGKWLMWFHNLNDVSKGHQGMIIPSPKMALNFNVLKHLRKMVPPKHL